MKKHKQTIQNTAKKHVLLCQKDMLAQSPNIIRHMLTKTDVLDNTGIGVFEIKFRILFHIFLGANNNKANQSYRQTATFIDHILTKLPDKVSQSGAIVPGQSGQDLICCRRKTSLPRHSLNEKLFRRNAFGNSKRDRFHKLSYLYLCKCLLRFCI